jgi:hypothetical protein
MRHVTSASCLLLATVALANPKQGSEALVVPSVRVKFEVPNGWHELSSAEVVESRQRIRLSDPELNRYLAERARIPKLTFTKHPSDFPSLNPTLQVYTAATGGRSAEEMARATVRQMSQLSEFKLVEPPHAVSVRGRRAAMLRATFPMTASGATETVVVEARMLVVVDGQEAAVFGLSGRATGEDRVEAEFQRLLASIAPVE